MDQNSVGGIPPMQNQAMNGGYAAPVNPGMTGQPMTAPMMAAPTMPPSAQPMTRANAPSISQPKAKNDSSMIETIILATVCVVAAAAIIFAVYFYMQWRDLSVNTDTKINAAVADAEKTLTDKLEAEHLEESKLPNSVFSGPEDYGSLSFNYPKTWNVYESTVVDSNVTTGDYVAYFMPNKVLAITDQTARYALRFTIKNQDYATVNKTYENLVTANKVTATMFTADNNAITGMRYTGELRSGTNAINGIVVVAKINDKTVIIQTDSTALESDFNTVVESLRKNS